MQQSKKATPTITIVIPAFNEAESIGLCLAAIKAQTHQPDRVVVIDNNSSDATAEIARSYGADVIAELHQGIVYARNAGFDAVTTDLIGRIDADVHLPQDWVAHVVSYYSDDQHMRTAWTGRAAFYNMRVTHIVAAIYNTFAFHFNRIIVGTPTLWGSSMALPTTLWHEVRTNTCSRDDIHEDLDLALHIHDQGHHIFYDHSIETGARLQHVLTNRGKLWDYLKLWPRTLRVHRHYGWVLAFLIGAVCAWPLAYVVVCIDWIGRHFGRPLETMG